MSIGREVVIVVATILMSAGVQAKEPVKEWKLTEKGLVREIKEHSPQMRSIEEGLYRTQYMQRNFDEQFQWQWVTKFDHSKSKEKAIANFIPTFGPTYRYSTGVAKRLAGGLSLEANVFTDQQSTVDNFIDEATRTGYQIGISVDLWKNLFGRIDRAQLEDLELSLKKQKLESKISKRMLELDLRAIYWSLVANQEQIEVSKELLRAAESQLKAGLKRESQYAADRGEVARYRAQVASRMATVKNLEFQRDQLIQTLKEQLPHLASAKFTLAPVNTSKNFAKIYQCAKRIGASDNIPWENTEVDELIGIIEKSYEEKQTISRRYSDLDVQLTSQYQSSGVAQGYSNSYDDFIDNRRGGYSVGLQITVPLGGEKSEAKEALITADYKQFLAEKNKFLAQVRSQQSQIVSMIELLWAATESLKKNGDSLDISIASSKQKFRQARISLDQLINEQDALLNSRLGVIETKLQIARTMLSYFKTFTEDPCDLNKIGEI